MFVIWRDWYVLCSPGYALLVKAVKCFCFHSTFIHLSTHYCLVQQIVLHASGQSTRVCTTQKPGLSNVHVSTVGALCTRAVLFLARQQVGVRHSKRYAGRALSLPVGWIQDDEKGKAYGWMSRIMLTKRGGGGAIVTWQEDVTECIEPSVTSMICMWFPIQMLWGQSSTSCVTFPEIWKKNEWEGPSSSGSKNMFYWPQ